MLLTPEDIKIEFKKLGKKRALGLAYKEENRIELDSSLKGKDFINVMIHEVTHIMFPYLIEDVVDNYANTLAEILYKHGVNKNEESSNKIA